MVRDNFEKTVVQSQKPKCAAVKQSQSQGTEENQQAQSITPEEQEPSERQLDVLLWNKLHLEEKPETWQKVSTLVFFFWNGW